MENEENIEKVSVPFLVDSWRDPHTFIATSTPSGQLHSIPQSSVLLLEVMTALLRSGEQMLLAWLRQSTQSFFLDLCLASILTLSRYTVLAR